MSIRERGGQKGLIYQRNDEGSPGDDVLNNSSFPTVRPNERDRCANLIVNRLSNEHRTGSSSFFLFFLFLFWKRTKKSVRNRVWQVA